ncbi:hypothetical protein IFR05_009723 [Cadophora sp. M221]|nr:hypothetical protein IFR05_009723 [Cadophora sp. M221]
MVRVHTLALLVGILGAASAKDCPPDRFPDCCTTYGTASPDTMRNSFHVPEHRVPQTNVPVGYAWALGDAKNMVLKLVVVKAAGRAGAALQVWVSIASEMAGNSKR